MAKITIEELFYGDKYAVMGEVVKQVFARQDEFKNYFRNNDYATVKSTLNPIYTNPKSLI